MSHHIPYWIAADLLAQARGHGVPLSADFSSELLGIIQRAQRSWIVGQREADEERLRDLRRRESARRGWF